MAFGFFKKNSAADLILKNGRIITLDADVPEAEAVACREGKIIAVGDGDSLDEFWGGNTRVVDLQGKCVLPGFISLWDEPVMQVFSGLYADLTPCSSAEDVKEAVSLWAGEHPAAEVVFGYGYNEGLLPQEKMHDPAAIAEVLDEACADRPVLLLCENNVSCLLNSAARDVVKETAEEEVVRYITTPYILDLFSPIDFDVIEERVAALTEQNAAKGVTSLLSLSAPDYFDGLYQDALLGLHNDELLKQRFFSSYFMNRPLMPEGLIHRLMARKTNCNEMEGLIGAQMLAVSLDSKSCPVDFTQEALDTILLQAAERKFSIYIKAAGEDDLLQAFAAVDSVRAGGGKSLIAIESACAIPESVKSEMLSWETAYFIDAADREPSLADAPSLLELTDELGVIKAGALADMVVFPEDFPQKHDNLLSPAAENAVMTVFNGAVVYE